jgi:hypothetical protein
MKLIALFFLKRTESNELGLYWNDTEDSGWRYKYELSTLLQPAAVYQ